MSETTLQKVEAEVQKLTAELESLERAQVRRACADAVRKGGDYCSLVWWLLRAGKKAAPRKRYARWALVPHPIGQQATRRGTVADRVPWRHDVWRRGLEDSIHARLASRSLIIARFLVASNSTQPAVCARV